MITLAATSLNFYQIVTKPSKIRSWDPRSGIRDPEKTYSGSRIRGQKGTGSRIRIRNTVPYHTYICDCKQKKTGDLVGLDVCYDVLLELCCGQGPSELLHFLTGCRHPTPRWDGDVRYF
jgi:hypothetical protein